MKTKLFFILALIVSANICQHIKAQTLYVPGGTGGIGNNTANGNVGIGTGMSNPSHKVDVLTGSETYERVLRLRVEDSPNDRFEVLNGTGMGGQFIPYLNGYHETDNRVAIFYSGTIPPNMDYGDNPVVIFDARYQTGPVQNRPLFTWTSYDATKMTLTAGGNLLLGKTTQTNNTYRLDVAGKVRVDEIVVNTTGADFVFGPNYKLLSLSELETFIRTNKHLPDIAPAREMQEHGVSAGEMQAKLLQKVEELTLYMIDLKKENERIKAEKDKQIGDQQVLINEMQKRLDALENK